MVLSCAHTHALISERPHDLRAVPLLQLLLVGGRQPVQVQAGQRAVVAQRAREQQVAVARERVRVQPQGGHLRVGEALRTRVLTIGILTNWQRRTREQCEQSK